MAIPTIVYNASTGSDTAASGAGPATAKTGTKARARSAAASARVGFFETTDLSAVVATGAHALYIGTAAGSRHLSKITAVKDIAQTTVGTMDKDANQTVVTDTVTTGMTAGDVISVAGAGAAGIDLYTTIATVTDGTNLILTDPCSTDVTAAALVNPRQVTCEDTHVATTDLAWAIGGKRLTLEGEATKKDWSDMKAGWTFQFDAGTYNITVSIAPVAGDVTSGSVTLIATAGAAAIINSTANIVSYVPLKHHVINGLTFTTTSASKTTTWGIRANSADPSGLVVDGCTVNGVNIGMGLNYGSTWLVRNTRFVDCITAGWRNNAAESGGNVEFDGCVFYHCETGLSITYATSNGTFILQNCLVILNHTDGIAAPANAPNMLIVRNCIIDRNGDGIDLSGTLAPGTVMLIENNQITNNTIYGIRGPSNPALEAIMADYNAFYNNSSGALLNLSSGAHDVTMVADPYVDSPNGDYRPGTNASAIACRNAGFPQAFLGLATTDANVSIGACEMPAYTAPAVANVWHDTGAFGYYAELTPTKVATSIPTTGGSGTLAAADVKTGVTVDGLIVGSAAGGAGGMLQANKRGNKQ
jgi:hypothetical protein